MTKLSALTEKPPTEVVNLHPTDDDGESDSDDDMKKNIYNEIPEYDDVDEVKLAVETLEAEAALQQRQNAANENLYSEIQSSEEWFENALYMAGNAKEVVDEKRKGSAAASIAIFPSMSPKTRSFYPVGSPLPSIPPKMMIPEESEPSWCCGTRRRRRRSLILGLFVTVFFLLFLCIALLVRMYVPPPGGADEGFQGFDAGISTAEFLQHDADVGSWEADNQIGPSTTPKPRQKTKHTASICTSWQGKRLLSLSCEHESDRIDVVNSYYGWSRSEAVCHNAGRDTYCKHRERDTSRCEGRNDCEFWADASGWLLGCSGAHDYLQVDYYCVPPS